MAWRVRRHRLDRRVPAAKTIEVAGALCGLHAQLTSSAELTLWARVADLERSAVADALWEDRTLVKIWAMRGTLHVLPAAEFGLWQAALSTYRHYLKPSWLRAFGVTAGELEQLLDAIAHALDGQILTRQELATAVGEHTGSPELGEKVLGSWGPFLKPACVRGLLCFAPSAGQNVRFTRPDRWLGPYEVPPPEDATLEVARRFLFAHGPATTEDYARWWGMTPAQAAKVLKRLGEEVVPVDIEGTQAWLLAADRDEAGAAEPARTVRLLPAFDQFVVAATRHARHLLPGPFQDRIYRSQGWLSPVVLVDGRFVGLWRHERRGNRLEVQVEPFVRVAAKVRRAVEEEAERLAAFLGGRLALAWTDQDAARPVPASGSTPSFRGSAARPPSSARQISKTATEPTSQASPRTSPPITSDRKWTPRRSREQPMAATSTPVAAMAAGRRRGRRTGSRASSTAP